MRFVIAICMGLATASLLGIGAAEAAIKVDVTWNRVEVEIFPAVQTNSYADSDHFTLEGKSVSRRGGVSKLGSSLQGVFNNYDYVDKFSISGGRVVDTWTYANGFTGVVVVRTNGVDACSAEISYRKKKGHANFDLMTNGEITTSYSKIYATDVTCSISR